MQMNKLEVYQEASSLSVTKGSLQPIHTASSAISVWYWWPSSPSWVAGSCCCSATPPLSLTDWGCPCCCHLARFRSPGPRCRTGGHLCYSSACPKLLPRWMSAVGCMNLILFGLFDDFGFVVAYCYRLVLAFEWGSLCLVVFRASGSPWKLKTTLVNISVSINNEI